MLFWLSEHPNDLSEFRLDYEIGVTYFAAYSDYIVINVSSPNTPGLRAIQKKSDLQKVSSLCCFLNAL